VRRGCAARLGALTGLALSTVALLAPAGCASSRKDDFHDSPDDYYRRAGTIHRESFPSGSGSPYGRYGRYGRYPVY